MLVLFSLPVYHVVSSVNELCSTLKGTHSAHLNELSDWGRMQHGALHRPAAAASECPLDFHSSQMPQWLVNGATSYSIVIIVATLVLRQVGSIYRVFGNSHKRAEKKEAKEAVRKEQVQKLRKREFQDSINVSLNMLQEAGAGRRKLIFRTLFTASLGSMFDENDMMVEKVSNAALGTTVAYPFMHLLNDALDNTSSEWPCLTKILNKISGKYSFNFFREDKMSKKIKKHSYWFALSCEKDPLVPQQTIRVMLASGDMLETLSKEIYHVMRTGTRSSSKAPLPRKNQKTREEAVAFLKLPQNLPEFERPSHGPRWSTMLEMADLYLGDDPGSPQTVKCSSLMMVQINMDDDTTQGDDSSFALPHDACLEAMMSSPFSAHVSHMKARLFPPLGDDAEEEVLRQLASTMMPAAAGPRGEPSLAVPGFENAVEPISDLDIARALVLERLRSVRVRFPKATTSDLCEALVYYSPESWLFAKGHKADDSGDKFDQQEWKKYQGQLHYGSDQDFHNGSGAVLGPEIADDGALAAITLEVLEQGEADDRYNFWYFRFCAAAEQEAYNEKGEARKHPNTSMPKVSVLVRVFHWWLRFARLGLGRTPWWHAAAGFCGVGQLQVDSLSL